MTLGELTKTLNRSTVYVRGLQKRFELPTLAVYPEAYLSCLRTIVFLRMMNVSEEALLELWHLERKLLQLLRADSSGSPTWFLDCCGHTDRMNRRLLLTNYDIGVELRAQVLQLGLDFSTAAPELFGGQEMGEDALRVLNDYMKLYSRIHCEAMSEVAQIRAATKWAASRLK